MTTAFTVPLTSFEVPFEIVVLGVITGLIYALLGMGLVLVYRSARVINFAHGDMGALPAGLLLLAVVRWNFPYPAALALALVTTVAIGGLVEFLVIRRLSEAPRLVVLVATIGVSQILLALNLLIPRDDLGPVRYPTPFQVSFSIGDLRLGAGELLIMLVAPAATVGLMVFLHRSRIGLGSRASAENLEAAKLAGVPTRRVSVAVWVLAALLSVLAAILIAPTRAVGDVSTSLGPALMLRALAAAMLGGMASYPQVFAAGVGIGVIELLTSWNHPTGGAVEIVLLAVILLSLVVRRGLGAVRRGAEDSGWSLGAGIHALAPALAGHPRVRTARRALLVGLAVVAVAAPLPMQSAQRVLLSSVLLYAVMGLSVVVLTGFAGQISLGQFAFVGLGAAVGGRMFQLGYPAWMGILYAVVAGGLTAVVVGLPAVRLRGLFLAVTTLGFSVALAAWLPSQDWLINVAGGRTSLELPRQRWLGVDLSSELRYYQLCLVLLVVTVLLVNRIRRSGLGRAMMAVRDNEPAAATYSLSPRRVKLVAFAVSGMLASFAGYFYGGLLVNFTDAGLFNANAAGFGGAAAGSLALVSMVIFGGVTTVTGVLLGALWIRGIPYMLGSNFGILSSGLGIIVVLQMAPGGLASVAFRLRDRLAAWLTGLPPDQLDTSPRAEGVPRASLPAAPRTGAPAGAPSPLVGRDITVRFGGLVAVDHVTLEAGRGEIVGLVGPNGAGKTTLFDVLSGQLRPDHGDVLLNGADVTALRPEARARLGLGRTFQEARLFPELPLLDALKLALERHDPSEAVPSMLALPPSLRSERAKQARAEEIVDLLGLGPFARRNCSELSTGTRRLAELGCVVAMGCDVVLLDEPAAGIAQREVEAFTPVLREVRDHLGATMVVIDHDLPMILGLVDRLYVMATGRVIAEGDPHALRDDPAVIAAYLGADERVIHRSGAAASEPPGGSPRRERPLRAGTAVGAARPPH